MLKISIVKCILGALHYNNLSTLLLLTCENILLNKIIEERYKRQYV